MMTTETMHTAERNDADLVAESLDGSRDAFRQIVERYQTLICSLAYSAIGNVSQSEDVAQETFISAWKDLRSLREPDKLRSWLCAIARNRTQRSLQREGREPVHNAAPLENAHDSPACDALPSEQAISREEEAILWRSLEKIPELYREPLIVFYRERQSIESVAVELELSEDAVKQRLSRGRKLLQEEVQGFVEGALQRTAPGQAFSNAVLAVLPLAAGPAATAGVGAGAKGTAAAKSGFLAAWVAPFIGIAAGIVAQWLIICATTTDRKLRVKRIVQIIVGWILLLGVAIAGPNAVIALRHHFQWNDRTSFVAMVGFWWFYTMFMVTLSTMGFGHILGVSQQSEEAGKIPRPAVTPMKPGTLAVVVAGGHLMLFSWLIRLAWRADDLMAAGIITGMMVVLGIAAYFNTRGRIGAALARATSGHVAVCSAVILAAFNLRLDVWMASGYGVSVAEIHRLLPTWIVPLLSLALVIWSGLVLALTKPKPRLR
jgi:RNA polymerase sigma factor (sigma-70 family)